MVWTWIINGIGRLLLGLKLIAAGIVGRVLATFGLTMISFNAILPNLKAFVLQLAGGLPSWALNLIGYLNLGVAMSMVISALMVRAAWKVFIVPTTVADAIQGGTA